MSIVITLEVDDKGSAKIKDFSNNANKDLDSVAKSGSSAGSQLSSSFMKVGDILYSTTTAITKFALALSTGALVAGAGGIALVTEKAGALEQQMSYLGAILGTNDSQIGVLRESILGLSTSTQFMSKDIAGASTTLAQAGFTAEEVTAALPGVLSLASAGAIDLATASDVASSSLRAFGFATSETGKVADVLAMASIKTNATVGSLGEALKYVGPVAKTAGISFQETSAAIGLLGNVGIQGSMAGTTLRAAIASLLAPTQQQTDILQSMGVQVKDSSGKMLSLTNIIGQLQTAGIQTGEVLELFGLRGGPGMAALISMGSDSLKDLTIELENAGGSADSVGKEKLNNFGGQMQIAKSNIDAFMIALGDPMLPIFKDFLSNQIIPAIQNMVTWAKANKEEIGNFGTSIVHFLSTTSEAAKIFLQFFQSYAMPLISTTFKSIGDVLAFAGSMINTFVSIVEKSWNAMLTPIRAMGKIWEVMGLDTIGGYLQEASFDFSGVRSEIEKFSVSSLTLGDELSDLTMKGNDLLYGFNNIGYSSKSLSDTTKKLNTDTSTLATSIDGSLTPSLMDAEYEYQKMQNEQAIAETNQISLANSTVSSVGMMNNSLDSLAYSWDGVGNSIGYATESVSSFGDASYKMKDMQQAIAPKEESYQFKTQGEADSFRKSLLTQLFGVSVGAERGLWGGMQTILPNFQTGGFVPGSPNQAVPAILHGGETVVPYGSNMVVQLVLNEKVLAEEIININDRNVSGFGNKFSPSKKNIKNFQQMGA